MNIVKYIQKIIFGLRLKRAIKRANAWHDLTKKTYLVMLFKGRPEVLAKQDLKVLWKRGALSGTWQQVESRAIYSTMERILK
jgi:hypothetical protein